MNRITSLSVRNKIITVMFFALLIRLIPLSFLFSAGRVTFVSYDSYYHIRNILYTTQHFPNHILFDSYINYPFGFDISWPPLYDMLISLIALIIGLGNPSNSTIELVAALFPVVLGGLSLIPLYFVASYLFDSRTSFYSIVVLSIMPIHLAVSMFGATDHHIAEILLSSTAFLFFILSLREGFISDVSSKLIKNDLSSFVRSRPVLYALCTGIILVLSALTWTGSPIFMGIFALYLPVQLALDMRAKRNSFYLLLSYSVMYLSAIVLIIPFILLLLRDGYELSAAFVSWFHVLYLLLMLLFGITCWIFSFFLAQKGRWWHYLFGVFIFIAFIVFGMRSAMPTFFSNISSGIGYLLGFDETLSTINEALPLFWNQYGQFTLSSVWNGFGLFFLLFLVSITLIFLKGEPSKNPTMTFFVIWSIIVFALAFSQRRFMYLLSINVSVLSGYFMGQLHSWLVPKTIKTHATKHKNVEVHQNNMLLLLLIGMLLLPGALLSVNAVSNPSIMPSDWGDTLDWIKENTPKTSYYNEPHQIPEYGVMSWWDFGNWIIYRSQRPVVTNNFQPSVKEVADFFISQNEMDATSILEKRNVKYIVTDISMVKGKFFSIAKLAGEDYNSFFDEETVYSGLSTSTKKVENNKFMSTMLVRLHIFDGSTTGHYRLVYESNTTVTKNPEVKYVKVFEYVPGVTLKGKAQPDEVVYGATTIITNNGRKFDYYNSAVADSSGNYTLVLAYPTQERDSSTYAILPYTIIGDKSRVSKKVNVTESEVQTGEVLMLDIL